MIFSEKIGLIRPFGSLTNEDIDGAKSQIIKFSTTRPPSNPLAPEYKLQSFTLLEPPVPRFVRDQMNIDDIVGSKPRVERYMETRDHYNVKDIDGASPKKSFSRSFYHDQEFKDVYAKK